MLIPEPLAYFWSTLALWLLARALHRARALAVARAVAALVLAPAMRAELEVLLVAGLVAAALCRDRPRGRRLIGSWSRASGSARSCSASSG